jgi:DNA helicase-4
MSIEEVGMTKSLCVKGYCFMRKADRTFAIERITDLVIDPDKIEYWENTSE